MGGQVFGIKFLEELGDAAGGLGGVAAAGLTALAIGVSPVYAQLLGQLVEVWTCYQDFSLGIL